MSPAAPAFVPPAKFDEGLKYALVPGPLYIRYLVAKAWRKGEAELRLVPFLADPARVSLDVGANKGIYAHVLARHSRHVYAFEPNPKIFRVLTAWRHRRVTALPYALSNADGGSDLLIPRGARGYSNQGASLSRVKVSGAHAAVPVDARRLDGLGLADVGFIKIDVEGFEREVLEGATATLARDRPRLLIEMEEAHTRRPIEQDLAFVESLGYRGYFLRNRTTLTPLTAFDPEAEHRLSHASGTGERRRYVFNFIFLPA